MLGNNVSETVDIFVEVPGKEGDGKSLVFRCIMIYTFSLVTIATALHDLMTVQ